MTEELFKVENIFEEPSEAAKRVVDIQRLRDDYISTFGTTHGKRVLIDLLKQSYVFVPFNQQNAGAYLKEGKRELGLYILGCLGLSEDPNQLARLVRMLQPQQLNLGEK